MILLIYLSTTLVIIILRFKNVLCESVCPFGWQFNQQTSLCVINCNGLSGVARTNDNCQLPAFSDNVVYDSTLDTMSMKPGNHLNIPISYNLPNCYSVVLTSSEYNVTSDANYQVNYKIPFLFQFSVIKSDNLFISFCFPLSPQLLQCELEATRPGSYTVENGTTLVIPEKGFSAYLGDFYIDDDGTAYTCPQSITSSLYFPPRCHYIPLYPTEYYITDTGAMYIPKANFSIKNPSYSFIIDGITHACFPLTIEYLDCPIRIDWAPYYFQIEPSLVAFHKSLEEYFTPDSYYTTKDYNLELCLNDKDVYIDPIVNNIFIAYVSFEVISAICLLITLIFQMDFYKTNYHTKCLLMHIICLILMYISICLKKFIQISITCFCYIMYVFNYYSYMAAFFWLNVIAYDSWKTFGKLQTSPNYCRYSPCSCRPISNGQRYLYYNIYAWGMALLLTVITLIIELSPTPRDTLALNPEIALFCWFNNVETTAIYFYGPLGILMAANLIFFVLTVYAIHHAGRGTDIVNQSRRKQTFEVAIKLFVLMGLVWIVDVICFILHPFDTGIFKCWYISKGLTSVQGIVIFVIYFTNKEVLKALLRNIRACRFPFVNPIENDNLSRQISNHSQTRLAISVSH